MQNEIGANTKITFKDLFRVIGKSLTFLYKVDRKRMILTFSITASLSVFSVLFAWYFSKFLDVAIYSVQKTFFTREIIFVLVLMLCLQIVQSIFKIWEWRMSMFLARNIRTATYVAVTTASERIDIQTYEGSDFALLKDRVNRNLGRMQEYADVVLDCLTSMIPMIISVVIVISFKKWILLLLIMIPAFVGFWSQVLDGKTLWECENMAGETRKKFISVYGFYGSKNYIEEIKINGLHTIFVRSIKELMQSLHLIFLRRETMISKRQLLSDILGNAVELIIPVVLIYQIFTGQLLVGAFYFLNGRFANFSQSFKNILNKVGRMYKDAPYVSDIFKFLEMQPVLPNGTKTFDRFETLEVKDLGFTYPESDRVILHDFDFTIKRGEKIAVIGLNGAGKTTMTKLLLRFYFPTSGLVQYNGTDIQELDKYNLYQHVGFLPQDFAKFDLTFAESIALGNAGKDIDNDKVIDAAKKANVHEFIMSHKDGYQTQIGKKYKDGVELSGGQWQKMAIASMFYRNAELWILDEPTSAIDAEAEASIFESLAALPDDITVIMISHRFSTVRNADRIMVIDHGGVKESGTHEELLKVKDGEYARLFAIQAEGYK